MGAWSAQCCELLCCYSGMDPLLTYENHDANLAFEELTVLMWQQHKSFTCLLLESAAQGTMEAQAEECLTTLLPSLSGEIWMQLEKSLVRKEGEFQVKKRKEFQQEGLAHEGGQMPEVPVAWIWTEDAKKCQ